MTLSPLNPEQREAVGYLDGPCLVLAGAGSGKTRVITAKIAHLLERGYKAENIAAITFTNKAAHEMLERIRKLAPSSSHKLTISTFHSLGMRILRAEAKALNMKSNFTILDSADSAAVLSDILATTDKQTLRKAQTQISLWKNAALSPDQAWQQATNESEGIIAKAFMRYQQTVKAYQAVDFDDLIALPLRLLEEKVQVRERWQNLLRYLLIDEVQDTNNVQYALIKHLTGPRAMFTAVGDDDQSIYGWRGADIKNLADLKRSYPQLKLIKLEQNYRSTNRILAAANALISHNPKLFEKKLWSEHGTGDPITVLPMEHEDAEAENIVTRLSAHRFERRAKFSDYAILYRGNHQARVFETHLRQQRIPYLISGGQSFFDRAEIKDITAYLRLIANEEDDQAFLRAVSTPKRGIGPVTLSALAEYATARKTALFNALFESGFSSYVKDSQRAALLEFGNFINRIQFRAGKDSEKTAENAGLLLQELIEAINYQNYLYDSLDNKQALNKWNNVQELVAWLTRKAQGDPKTGQSPKSLMELAQHIALITLLQETDHQEDAVHLSTLHAAKGLEYPHVFLVGLEEGLLPHESQEQEEIEESAALSKLEEERRLMYVGVTRAQRSLIISYCTKRKRGKEWVMRKPSRFLIEMGVNQSQSEALPLPQDTRAHFAALKDLLAQKAS